MKEHYSLTELAVELERQKASKVDAIAHTSQIRMNENAALEVDINGTQAFEPTNHAHNQISAHLDIPKRYYERMKQENPKLLADNVNNWLERSDSKRMLRTLDGKTRAYVSDRFNLGMENADIAEAALPSLIERGAIVRSSSITEKRMYIKAVLPSMEMEVKVGDPVRWGIILSNSEVGAGALTIQAFMERLVCTNGMVMEDGKYSKRHLGAAHDTDEYAQFIQHDTRRAQDRAITLQIRDIIQGTLTDAFFAQSVLKMQEATQQKITGNPVEAVQVLAKREGLSEAEQSGILSRLIEGADLSQYGLLNAVTNMAEAASDYERATELEALGGKVLDLSPQDWRVLAEAA